MFDWRSPLLRRLARRFLHIGDDVLRHLSTFQRLGERLELEPPGEMLPVGARTLVRALRTRSAAQIRPDWLWPFWLERQLSPEAAEFVPRGHLPFATNVTHRNWTAVGNLASPWEAIVDPTGLLTPAQDSWSVDWWVFDGDRWHLPSRDPGLRQRLVEATPAIETVLEHAAGQAVQRVYAARVGGEEHVVMEVANQGGTSVEVAFAVRPYNPEGLAVTQEVTVDVGAVIVDGQIAMVLPDPPRRAVLSTYHRGDALGLVEAGLTADLPATVSDPAGLAHAAVVLAAAPGATVRVTVPLPPRPDRGAGMDPTWVEAGQRLPGAGEVVDEWREKLRQGMQARLPDERLQQAVDANRAFLLLLHDPGDITAGPSTYHRFWFRDAAYQLVALDRWGFHDEAVDVLSTYPDRQRGDGFFYSQWREWDANGAALWAVAEHDRLTRDDTLLAELLPSLRRGVSWIERTRGRSHRPELIGLLPAGVSAEHLGPFDYYYWDDFWALRGLLDGAYLAHRCGETDAAAAIDAAARRYRADILASIRRTRERTGLAVIPAGPFRGIDAGMIGSLVACAPLQLLRPDDPLLVATLDVIRERFCLGEAFFQSISHTGLGTYLTLQLAFVELEAGDARAWRRLRWLLDAATPTFTWPEAIHPRLGGGCMGDGHHGWAAADFLNFIRCTLLREQPDGAVALLGVLPPEWRGREVEVRHAPTHSGKLSYLLRWDGERPVLAWEWEQGGTRLLAPGLDGGWSSDARSGEATLAAPHG